MWVLRQLKLSVCQIEIVSATRVYCCIFRFAQMSKQRVLDIPSQLQPTASGSTRDAADARHASNCGDLRSGCTRHPVPPPIAVCHPHLLTRPPDPTHVKRRAPPACPIGFRCLGFALRFFMRVKTLPASASWRWLAHRLSSSGVARSSSSSPSSMWCLKKAVHWNEREAGFTDSERVDDDGHQAR